MEIETTMEVGDTPTAAPEPCVPDRGADADASAPPAWRARSLFAEPDADGARVFPPGDAAIGPPSTVASLLPSSASVTMPAPPTGRSPPTPDRDRVAPLA